MKRFVAPEVSAAIPLARDELEGQLGPPSRLGFAYTATLFESDRCEAEGLIGVGDSPVLDLCRKLVAAGQDPDRPLHAYRGDTLCLRIRSLGEAATLEVSPRCNGFRPRRDRTAALPNGTRA
jgi:hypothetical protein